MSVSFPYFKKTVACSCVVVGDILRCSWLTTHSYAYVFLAPMATVFCPNKYLTIVDAFFFAFTVNRHERRSRILPRGSVRSLPEFSSLYATFSTPTWGWEDTARADSYISTSLIELCLQTLLSAEFFWNYMSNHQPSVPTGPMETFYRTHAALLSVPVPIWHFTVPDTIESTVIFHLMEIYYLSRAQTRRTRTCVAFASVKREKPVIKLYRAAIGHEKYPIELIVIGKCVRPSWPTKSWSFGVEQLFSFKNSKRHTAHQK